MKALIAAVAVLVAGLACSNDAPPGETCAAGQAECGHAHDSCIDAVVECDGVDDCDDGRDEQGCG